MRDDRRARRDNNHSDPRPVTRDDLTALDRKIDLLIELMCPKCGPAAIVRMHPELGPQALKPLELPGSLPIEGKPVTLSPNGHEHS